MRKRRLLVMLCMLLCFSGCAGSVNKGAELLAAEKYQEAEDAFQAAVAKGRNLSEAYQGLGTAQLEQGKYKEGLQAFEEALQEGADKTAVLYNLAGICALQSEEYEKAVFYFEEGAVLAEAGAELKQEMMWNLVVSYEKLGEYQIANEKLNEYLSNYPDDEKALKEQEFLSTQS